MRSGGDQYRSLLGVDRAVGQDPRRARTSRTAREHVDRVHVRQRHPARRASMDEEGGSVRGGDPRAARDAMGRRGVGAGDRAPGRARAEHRPRADDRRGRGGRAPADGGRSLLPPWPATGRRRGRTSSSNTWKGTNPVPTYLRRALGALEVRPVRDGRGGALRPRGGPVRARERRPTAPRCDGYSRNGERGCATLCSPVPPGFEDRSGTGVPLAVGVLVAAGAARDHSRRVARGGSEERAGRLAAHERHPPDPGRGPPIPRTRAVREAAARPRRGFVVFVAIVVIVTGALGWARATRDETSAPRPGLPERRPPAPGGAADRATAPLPAPDPAMTIVPGETPDRARRVHRQGEPDRSTTTSRRTRAPRRATEGGTIRCNEDGCRDGPVVRLTDRPDIYPHDLTHCFRCGLTAINGGKMNGFNRMNGVDPAVRERRPVRCRHDRVLLPRTHGGPELLGVRRPVRPRRSLLHVDVRPDAPRAPVRGRRAGEPHRRQQVDHRSRRQLLRRLHRGRDAVRAPRGASSTRRTILQLERAHHGERLERVRHRGLLGKHPAVLRHRGAARPARGGRASPGSTTRTRTPG